MSSRVLLTGFLPFGSNTQNPSEEVVRRIAANPPDGIALRTLVLPVVYRTAFAPVRKVLDARGADVVLHLGLGAARGDVQVERFALNWRGGELADESGEKLDGEPVDPSGPAARLSTVPVEGLVAALRETGVPCTASSHAGTFLCNQVLYQTLAHADRHELGVRAAFVHVPEPGPAGGRLDLDLLVRGITAAVRYAAALPRPGGGEAGRGGTRRASKRPPAARPRSRNSR